MDLSWHKKANLVFANWLWSYISQIFIKGLDLMRNQPLGNV